ncbi:unnamed protein product [Phaeothamnion confervicola]
MGEFVSSGNIALLALAVLALEAVLLTAFRHHLRAAPPPLDIALMSLAGAGLLLAMYCALTQRGWQAVALCFSLALVAHLTDLTRRCRPAVRGSR